MNNSIGIFSLKDYLDVLSFQNEKSIIQKILLFPWNSKSKRIRWYKEKNKRSVFWVNLNLLSPKDLKENLLNNLFKFSVFQMIDS